MALADRSFVWESQVVRLTDLNEPSGSTSIADTVYNMIKVFKTMDISITTEMMEANAAHDPVDDVASWHCPRPRSRNCTVELTAVVDGTGTIPHFIDIGLSGEDGQFQFDYSGPFKTGTSVACFTFSSLMSMDSADIRYPGDDAEQTIRLSSYGKPTVDVN